MLKKVIMTDITRSQIEQVTYQIQTAELEFLMCEPFLITPISIYVTHGLLWCYILEYLQQL